MGVLGPCAAGRCAAAPLPLAQRFRSWVGQSQWYVQSAVQAAGCSSGLYMRGECTNLHARTDAWTLLHCPLLHSAVLLLLLSVQIVIDFSTSRQCIQIVSSHTAAPFYTSRGLFGPGREEREARTHGATTPKRIVRQEGGPGTPWGPEGSEPRGKRGICPCVTFWQAPCSLLVCSELAQLPPLLHCTSLLHCWDP